jgi:hypothetical protein
MCDKKSGVGREENSSWEKVKGENAEGIKEQVGKGMEIIW